MREEKIIDYIGQKAMLEQLAEECCELGKAALKLARIERRENPTPVTIEEALESLKEEYTDVVQCAMELEIEPIEMQMEVKKERFFRRWRNEQRNGDMPIL